MAATINIDDLLKNFGITRDILIQKNQKYQSEFGKLDKYYERYKESPSESVLNATNSITIAFMEKLKKENPEIFDFKQEEEESEEVKVEDKFSKHKSDLLFYIDEGDQSAMDDLFNAVGDKNTKHLLTFDNFRSFQKALKGKNNLIISHLIETAERLKILPDVVMGRDGEILNLIFATKNIGIITKAVETAKDNKETPALFKKNMISQQAIELGDLELVSLVEDIEEKSEEEKEEPGETKKPKKKATAAIKEQAPLKDLVDRITTGQIPMDLPLVIRLEKKFAIKILDTAEEIAAGPSNTYRFIVPTSVSKYFDAKVLFTDNDFTIYEAKKTDFERQFGVSIYELGICWFNMLNMVSVEDVLCLFYLSNISSSLMVDRNNQQLREEYLANLKFAMQQPETNKISEQFFQIKESNLMSLKKSGFLDDQFCPTKLLYCAIVLHSFPFPAYTHPFEFVNIDQLSSMFQFKTVKGEFGNEAFYTDGDVLFHNFTDAGVTKFDMALTDISRTTILNLKSNGRSDITKKKGVINHFIPFIYSVPKSGVVIPTFTLRMLDVQGRKINWGVYELQHDTDGKFFVNSYALSTILSSLKKEDYNLMTYEGTLSDTIFASPKEGVIIQHENTYLAIRGIRANQFLADNFGKNWKKYYNEMYTKNHLNNEVLSNLDADMVKAIYTTSNVLISSTETGLQFTPDKKEAVKEYEPTFQKEVVKPTWQTKKDDRIYINPSYAKEQFDGKLLDVFDKIKTLRGEQRDEAILDEMYAKGIVRVFPAQLVYMGFGLKEYITDKPERINFKNKYKLTIPILLSFQPTYYLEKIA
jgi:hypothetical protein